MPTDNDLRMDRIRKLLDCETDVELAKALGTTQPRISRWRNVGFYKSTAELIDVLLTIINRQKKEIASLKKGEK